MSIDDVLNLARHIKWADGWAPTNFVIVRKEFPTDGLYVIASIEPDPASPENVLRCSASAFGLKSQKKLGHAHSFASVAELESSWHVTEFVNRTACNAVTAALAGAFGDTQAKVTTPGPDVEADYPTKGLCEKRQPTTEELDAELGRPAVS